MKAYVIVSDEYMDHLEDKVNGMIADGYRVHGGVCSGYFGDGHSYYYQAMVWGGAER